MVPAGGSTIVEPIMPSALRTFMALAVLESSWLFPVGVFPFIRAING